MNEERLVFDAVKAHRGWYVVEYRPPIHGYPFATLSLILLGHAESEQVAAAMEHELTAWLQRYPVPVMVSSFSDTGDLFRLSPNRGCDHLFGWLDTPKELLVAHWRVVPSTELPSFDLSASALRRIYDGVPYRTSSELKRVATGKQRSLWIGAAFVFLWLVVVPAAIAVIEYKSPDWLAWLVLVYSLSKAYVAALRLWGMWPRSVSEMAAEDEQRRMRHHHYHCEENPEGFRTLVAENMKRESEEQTRRETDELKQQLSGEAG